MLLRLLTLALLVIASSLDVLAQKGVWTDPQDASLPKDYAIQGEYVGTDWGAQVIALDKGMFQAVVYPGGLPGAGWNAKDKILLDGKLNDQQADFVATTGTRKYLAQSPTEFSAVSKFPPMGQQDSTGTIKGESFKLTLADGRVLDFKKTIRQSTTLGAKPPQGAIVLFDGTSAEAWNGGRLDEQTKFLNTDSKDITTKKEFNNYSIHLEFMLPFRPDARSQGRANSGFYQVSTYEVQVLDSFGLDGKNNECGGIYSKHAPKLNMCLPPLVWQTYDVDFTNSVQTDGKKSKNARLTVKLNGVVIHQDQEVDGPTVGARKGPEGTPGPIMLQGHGNPLQYRNIWLIER